MVRFPAVPVSVEVVILPPPTTSKVFNPVRMMFSLVPETFRADTSAPSATVNCWALMVMPPALPPSPLASVDNLAPSVREREPVSIFMFPPFPCPKVTAPIDAPLRVIFPPASRVIFPPFCDSIESFKVILLSAFKVNELPELHLIAALDS